MQKIMMINCYNVLQVLVNLEEVEVAGVVAVEAAGEVVVEVAGVVEAPGEAAAVAEVAGVEVVVAAGEAVEVAAEVGEVSDSKSYWVLASESFLQVLLDVLVKRMFLKYLKDLVIVQSLQLHFWDLACM